MEQNRKMIPSDDVFMESYTGEGMNNKSSLDSALQRGRGIDGRCLYIMR
jgi:hypothetical protein